MSSESPASAKGAQATTGHKYGERGKQVTSSLAPQSGGGMDGVPDQPTSSETSRRWAILSPYRISAVYLWILFIIVFTLLNPDTFLTHDTFRLVFSEGVVTCLLALAFLVPLSAKTYDLSVGSLLALSLGICVWLNLHTGLPAATGAILAVLATSIAGAISGFVVVKLRVNSFIATLGMSQVVLAIVLLISSNKQLIASFPQSYTDLGRNELVGLPLVDFYLLGIAGVLWLSWSTPRPVDTCMRPVATRRQRSWRGFGRTAWCGGL